MERRQLLSASPGIWATPIARAVPAGGGVHSAAVKPAVGQAGPGPGYTPAQLRTAYGLGLYGSSAISFNGNQANGAGETIAIVDAGDDPYAAQDLNTFSQAFGLPLVNQAGGPSFTKLNDTGGTTLPAVNPSWVGEESLDIEWFHAFAPQANIILFEANNLDTAVKTAAAYPGVVAVSMSYGGGESSGNPGTNSEYTTPAGHTGVTFLAATGDGGAGVEYPAASPNVVAVGGTTLNVNGDNTYSSEAGWSGSGGGVSAYETQPAYQNGVVSAYSTSQRTTPDVSIDAGSGVPICDSYDNGTSTPWLGGGYVEIGTSLACPLWCAVVTLADQGRAINGQQSMDGPSQTLPRLYQMTAGDYHDVTSINNGSTVVNGGAGYDLNTGRGTPIANVLVPDLAGFPAAAPFTSVDVGGPSLPGVAFNSQLGTTVTGSGSDIWLTSDQFHYDYQSVTGDGSIQARVATTPIIDTDGSTQSFAAKAGVMYRTSTAANAPFVDLVYTNGLGIQFISRATAGASATQSGPNISMSGPVYLKVSRNGSNYSGWYSTNGTTWTLDSTLTNAGVGSGVLGGLAVCSHDNTKVAAVTFGNVAILSSADIGGPGIAGGSTDGASGTTVTGSGGDIWNASDQFHYDSEAVAGDGTIQTRVTSVPTLDTDGTNSFAAKTGVMYRSSSAANSSFVDLVYTNGIGLQLLYRNGAGATAQQAGSNISVSGTLYLRLTRVGSTYTGWYSTNGTSWTIVSSVTNTAVGSNAYAGVVACSHDNTKLATTTFSNVSISVP